MTSSNSDAFQPGGLVLAAGRRHDAAALDLGDLADDRANRPGGAGDEDGLARLGLADLQEADIGGKAGHAGDAEEGLGRQVGRRQLAHCERCRGCRERLPPARHRTHKVAGFVTWITGGDDFAHGAAGHGLTQFEAGGVALRLVHAAAHVGVDRHPEVAHLDLAVGRIGRFDRCQLEIRGFGFAHRTRPEAPLTGCYGWHQSPLLQTILLSPANRGFSSLFRADDD